MGFEKYHVSGRWEFLSHAHLLKKFAILRDILHFLALFLPRTASLNGERSRFFPFTQSNSFLFF